MRDLDVAGRKVQIYESGAGNPLLYLHGVADMHGCAADAFPFHHALQQNFRLIAPAHPGCVGSDEDETIESVEDLAFHTLEVMDALGLERVDVLGTCVGGWLAAELAVRNPERIGKLALIGAPGLFISGVPIGDLFMSVQPLNGGIADLRAMLFSDAQAELADNLFPDQLSSSEMGMRRYQVFRFCARFGFKPPYFYHPKLRDRLYRFKGPAQIIWGAEDRFVPTSHAQAYADGFPGGTVEMIEGSGHAVHLEAPERVAEMVSAFFNA
jgi:pimeloyl-ACP methyl ester carboxylesterase